MTTNIEIEKVLKHTPSFIACISKDEITRFSPHTNGTYIINLQNSNKGDGSHWVLLHISPSNAIYFDSLGITVPPTIIQQFIKATGKPFLTSSSRFQSLQATTCGKWAILTAQLLDKSIPFTSIINEMYPKLIPNWQELQPRKS